MKTKTTLWTENYSQAVANQYARKIKSIIRKYYKNVSTEAINDFIVTGDFGALTAEELLIQANMSYQAIAPEVKEVATEFVIKVERLSNASWRKAYTEAGKPIPIELRATTPNDNLITQQVNKIKDLCNYQYQRINEATQNAIVQNSSLEQFKSALRESKIYNEKRINNIATNQLHFATNVTNISKAQELGIEQGIWIHPKDYRIYKTHPRPSHVKANGTVFDLKKGCKIDGEYIFPSQKPNCKCSWSLYIE